MGVGVGEGGGGGGGRSEGASCPGQGIKLPTPSCLKKDR